MPSDHPIRILFVEDLPTDVELAERELRKEGLSFDSLRVETKEAFLEALEEFTPDLIISDFALPEFDGFDYPHARAISEIPSKKHEDHN